MGLTARKPDSEDIEPIEAGVHQAICIRYYDLGTCYMEMFDKSARKVMIMWEIPDCRITIDNKDLPRALSKEYTLSLHKKANLRIDLESWMGRIFTEKELEGFNLDNVLGINCMLNLIHKTNDRGTFANVASVMPLMKGMEKRKPENPLISFSFDDPEIEIPKGTPQWIEDKIKSSEEWAFINREVGQESKKPPQDSKKGSSVDNKEKEDGLPTEEKPWSTHGEFMKEIKSFAGRLGTDVYDKIITKHKADLLNKLSKEDGFALWQALRAIEKAQDVLPWDEEEEIPEDDIPF